MKSLMIKLRFSVMALCGLLLFTSGVWAQKPKPRTRPAAKPVAKTPATTPATPANNGPASPAQSGPVLATVNGEKITVSDLGPEVAQAWAGEKEKIAGLRRDSLNSIANEYVLDAEAAKRNITQEALLDAEVNTKLKEPTEADLQAFYNANREQMQGQAFPAVREELVKYLKQQQSQQLGGALIRRLRATMTITGGVDVNTPNLAPTAVLATVAGKNILAGRFENRVAMLVFRQRYGLWNATMDVLEEKVDSILLIAAAKKRNLTPEQVFQKEVSEKIQAPTEAAITKFYNDNKANIPTPLAQARAQINEYLLNQQRETLVQALVQQVRVGSNVQLLWPAPEPPIFAVSADDDPTRGPANAPVTVIMFTDFQCPACAITHPLLDAVTSEFGDKVRWVVRDYPLPRHKDARKSAEAAAAAAAQGKFFDYIAILFKNQEKQDLVSLKAYATILGLDRAKFDAELDGGKYAAEVEHDVQDGQEYGIAGTPTIFVNGLRLEILSSDAMRAAIQDALKKAGKTD